MYKLQLFQGNVFKKFIDVHKKMNTCIDAFIIDISVMLKGYFFDSCAYN